MRRDEHLPRVPFPMLFVQGSRDELGDAAEIKRSFGASPGRRSTSSPAAITRSRSSKRDGGAEKQEAALDAAADAIAAFVRKFGGTLG